MEDRMSIIVYSGTVDKLMAVATLATGGAAMGLDVELFITFWGLEGFQGRLQNQHARQQGLRRLCPGHDGADDGKESSILDGNPPGRHGDWECQNLCLQHDHGTL